MLVSVLFVVLFFVAALFMPNILFIDYKSASTKSMVLHLPL
jgi:hypothetical protein